MTQSSSPMRGIFLMVSCFLFFTIMAGFVKATPRIPTGEAMFSRAFFAIPVILGWLMITKNFPAGIRTKNIKSHAIRSLAGTIAMGLGFAGLRMLPLPEATAIRFVTPVFMVILAALMLGERFRMIRMGAVLLGLLGVCVITYPRLSGGLETTQAIGALLTLASASMAAIAQIYVKSMSNTESTGAIAFYFSVVAACASLLTLPYGWVLPTPVEAAYLIGAGLMGGMGQIMLTASYKYADASVLAPFTYTSMLWSLIVGYFWFDEIPTAIMLLGTALIIASSAIIVWRERQVGGKTAERKVKAKRWQ